LLASVDPGLLSAAPPIEAALPSVLAFPGGIGIPKVITWASTAGDSGIAWGTSTVLAETRARISDLGFRAIELPALLDIDTEADLIRFERLFPEMAL